MNMCYTDYEMPDFFSQKWRVAREKHLCCECGQSIRPGQSYETTAGKWEGVFSTFKTCERCADLRESLSHLTCTEFGSLVYDYREFLEEAGIGRYDPDSDRYVYPENHLRLNDYDR